MQDVRKGGIGPSGAGDVSISGRISCGSVQIGEIVLAQPINEIGTIKSISIADKQSSWAAAGDQVSISLVGLDVVQLHLGSIICNPEHPVPISDSFEASIQTFDLTIPVTIGAPIIFHHLGTAESGFITRFLSLI